MRALGRSGGGHCPRVTGGRFRKVQRLGTLVLSLVVGMETPVQAEGQKVELSRRDGSLFSLLLPLPSRHGTIVDVADIRAAALSPSEGSRRELLALVSDPSRITEPHLRIELGRALHALQSSKVDSALTLALVSLLEHGTKEDSTGRESLAREVAAMALFRSPDPLARRTLEARAQDDETNPASVAARRVLSRPSASQPKLNARAAPERHHNSITHDAGRPTAVLFREFAAGRVEAAREIVRRAVIRDFEDPTGSRGLYLGTALGWLNDESEDVRRAACEGLRLRLRDDAERPDSVWIVGALAERYRVETSAAMRRILVAILARAPESRARAETLSLAADLEADRITRGEARRALGQKEESEG